MKRLMNRVRSYFASDFALCLLVYCIFFVFFFRAQFALSMFKGSDEFYYLRWMEGMLGNDYRHPGDVGDIDNHMALGTSLFWLPIGAIAHLFSHLLPGDSSEWVGSIVAFYSSFLWCVGLYLIWKTLEAVDFFSEIRFPTRLHRLGFSVLIYLNIPVLFFAFQRPLMAHTTEVIFSWFVLLLLIRQKLTYACIAAAFLSIVRYNDAVVFFLVLGRYLDLTGNDRVSEFKRKFFPLKGLSLLVAFTLIATILGVLYVAFIEGYAGLTLPQLLQDFSLANMQNFFFAKDWGVIWLLPVWTLALVCGLAFFKRFSWMTRFAWIWLCAEAVICICWGAFGGSFGRRYLIGSYVGVFLILFETIGFLPKIKKPLLALLALGALWLTYLTTAYRTVPGISFHTNPRFMLDMIQSIFHPDLYRYTFLHSPLGMFYKTSINLTADPVQYSAHASGEALIALWVCTSLVVVYLLIYGFFWRERNTRRKP